MKTIVKIQKSIFLVYHKCIIVNYNCGIHRQHQGLVKGAILCFRNLYFYFRHGESTSTASQLTSPASQKRKDLNKVSLLLQDLVLNRFESRQKKIISEKFLFISASSFGTLFNLDFAILLLLVNSPMMLLMIFKFLMKYPWKYGRMPSTFDG